jgi:general secretion pathway protein E
MIDDQRESELQFLEHLAHRRRISVLAVERLRRALNDAPEPLAGLVLKLGLMSEQTLASECVEFCGLAALQSLQLPSTALANLPIKAEFLRAREVVPLAVSAGQLKIAWWDTFDGCTAQALRFATGMEIIRYVGTRSTIVGALDALYPVDADADADNHRYGVF